jgi:glucose-1-phosphate cytidylyltransferase
VKVAILAGGAGTRLMEETSSRPKPMIEIGGRPILWHIMKHFSTFELNDFVIALGYKGEFIKKYLLEFASLEGNLTIDVQQGLAKRHAVHRTPNWNVDLIDTGRWTNTGGRIKQLAPFLGSDTFILANGDGVFDIDINILLDFHRSHGKMATVLAVRPQARFGHLEFDGERVREFSEKPQTAGGWINGGVYILESDVFDYIEGDKTQWEHGPMEQLAKDGQLMAYKHEGFWQCMDTMRDLVRLQQIWDSGNAPWISWDDQLEK